MASDRTVVGRREGSVRGKSCSRREKEDSKVGGERIAGYSEERHKKTGEDNKIVKVRDGVKRRRRLSKSSGTGVVVRMVHGEGEGRDPTPDSHSVDLLVQRTEQSPTILQTG